MEFDWSLNVPTLIAFASLIVLIAISIHQSKQLRDQLLVQNYIEFTRRYHEIIQRLPPEIWDPDFRTDSLSTEERGSLFRSIRCYFDLCSEEYFLYRKGLLSRDVWVDWSKGMRSTFQLPVFSEAWDLLSGNKDLYERFRTYVNSEDLTKKDRP